MTVGKVSCITCIQQSRSGKSTERTGYYPYSESSVSNSTCAHTQPEKDCSYFAQEDKNYKFDPDQNHLPFVSVNRRTKQTCNPRFRRFDIV